MKTKQWSNQNYKVFFNLDMKKHEKKETKKVEKKEMKGKKKGYK